MGLRLLAAKARADAAVSENALSPRSPLPGLQAGPFRSHDLVIDVQDRPETAPRPQLEGPMGSQDS
jgi:hypothetical protein